MHLKSRHDKLKRHIIYMEVIYIFSMPFLHLKPMDFARTYCFIIFAQYLLKFHDIESFLM
jgi:hypothetical protein